MKLELVGNVAKLLEEQPRNEGTILAVACPRNQHYRASRDQARPKILFELPA